MVMSEGQGQSFQDIIQTGLQTIKSTFEGITEILRTGDSTIRELDSALTGQAPQTEQSPEQAFIQIMALMQSAMQEAREHGSASADTVVQSARELLARVGKLEPAWRPGPAIVRNTSDMIRVALRDLRGSTHLLKLAQGQGSLDDLEALSRWGDDLSHRLEVTRKVVAPAQPEEVSEGAVLPAASPVALAKPKRKKRDTTPKNKGNPQDIAFAKAVAEEIGDTKVKQWAQDFAEGKISEKQWISRLTNHAAAHYDSLDPLFDRATKRMARESGGE